jgi:hypothetical protein
MAGKKISFKTKMLKKHVKSEDRVQEKRHIEKECTSNRELLYNKVGRVFLCNNTKKTKKRLLLENNKI